MKIFGASQKFFYKIGSFGRTCVAGPGIAPGLEDYEPSVLLYTTPRSYRHTYYMCSNCDRQIRLRCVLLRDNIKVWRRKIWQSCLPT